MILADGICDKDIPIHPLPSQHYTAMHPTIQVSVITVVYQAEALIERTLSSICSQDLRKQLQIVLVDGGSKDNTVALASKWLNDTDILISEPDKGIYDAMNKGLKAAQGSYVIFINAGDELFEPTTLSNMLGQMENVDVYYGETAIVDEQGRIKGSRRLTPPKNLNWRSFQFGMCVSHQSILAKRVLCPYYDLHYRISADIDWTIRLLRNCQTSCYTTAFVSKFLEGGVSSSRRKQGLKERWEILSKHYGTFRNMANHCWILVRFVLHRFTKKQQL
jgi:glycosyltransferase involved in cell wall biosynthesis